MMEERLCLRLGPLAFWLLALCLVLLFIPWLGLTPFNTKGEPREAIVALSMLQSGNWILPVSYGGDIPYKPPFLAWLIACLSWLADTPVNEFISRLPSAIAAILMGMGLGRAVLRSTRSMGLAVVTVLVMATSVEVWRAAWACRVDMVLTACMVGSILYLYRARERAGKPEVSLTATLLMAGAALTKGPVGPLLVALIMGIYFLLRADGLWRSVWTLAVAVVLSLIPYAAWCYAAALQGGEEFVRLMMEENIGRLTGTMTYDSHLNPWWYNLVTLVAGMLPYTLFLLFLGLAAIGKAKWKILNLKGLWGFIRGLRPFTLLSLTASVTVFIFYCIPASKRSVYLLPMYPFLAYFTALAIRYAALRGPRRPLALYAGIIAVVAVGACAALPFLPMTGPQAINPVGWILIGLGIALGVRTLMVSRRRGAALPLALLLTTVAVYCNVSCTVLPALLSEKSDRQITEAFAGMGVRYPVYTYNADPLMRWYSAAFYSGDRLRRLEDAHPESALLLVAERDSAEFASSPLATEYVVTDTVVAFTHRSGDTRSRPLLLHVRRR